MHVKDNRQRPKAREEEVTGVRGQKGTMEEKRFKQLSQ